MNVELINDILKRETLNDKILQYTAQYRLTNEKINKQIFTLYIYFFV